MSATNQGGDYLQRLKLELAAPLTQEAKAIAEAIREHEVEQARILREAIAQFEREQRLRKA